MPPSLSWTERDELAKLASRLQGSSSSSPAAGPAAASRVRFPLAAPRARSSSSTAAVRPAAEAPAPKRPSSAFEPRPEPPVTEARPPVRPLPPPGPMPPARLATAPTTGNSSASWQRPSFKSVELDLASIGLDLDALRASAAVKVEAPPSPQAATLPTPPVEGPVPEPPPASSLMEEFQSSDLVPLSGGRVSPALSLSSSLHGTFEEKLEVFLHWLMGSTGAYAAFVADGDGLEVANRHATEDLLAVTALIDRLLTDARRSLCSDCEGSVSIDLDETNVLHVVWVNTGDLRFAVGLVLTDSLEGALVRTIRKSFRAVAEPSR